MDGTPVARSLVAEVLATGKPVCDVERIVEHADGTTLIISVNIDPLRDAKGELVGAVNCFLDVTARKRADAALERSQLHALEQEQRLAATYEHAAIGISEVDPDSRFLRVNEAICAITGPQGAAGRQTVSLHASRRRRSRSGSLPQAGCWRA